MFPNIDNERGTEAVPSLLDSRSLYNPSTEFILEGLEICLLNNASRIDNIHILQTNRAETGTSKSCPYSDIVISDHGKIINQKRVTKFQACFQYG